MTYVGGAETLTQTLNTYGPSTSVAVSIAGPDGATPLTPPTTPDGDRRVWTATPIWTKAGRWVATWTVTGTGATVIAEEIWVERIPTVAADVSWSPSLTDVAAHISRFTIDTVTPGSVVEYGTFSPTTAPTDTQAARLTAQIVDALISQLGTVAAETQPLARLVAALRAAAAIARSFHRAPADITLADSLDRRADTEMRRLLVVDQAVDGGIDDQTPVFVFPDTTFFL